MSPAERSSQLQSLIESLTSATALPIEWKYINRGRTGKFILFEDIFKYMSDATSKSFFLADPCPAHLYDVVIADDVYRVKCILHPALNYLVESGALMPCSIGLIASCRVIASPNDATEPMLIITGLKNVHRPRSLKLNREADEKIWINIFEQKHIYRPLAAKRTYYLSLYNDDVPLEKDPIWCSHGPSVNESTAVPRNVLPVASLRSLSSAKGASLLVRVLGKSKLNHYGKPHANDHAMPWQFLLLLGDASQCIQAVLWNDLCPAYYYAIQEGDILLLSSFRVRSHSVEMTPGFDYELSLNPSHPSAIIQKIARASLTDAQLRHVNAIVPASLRLAYEPKIEGLVLYAGPIVRAASFRKDFGASDLRRFSEYRWLKVIRPEGECSIKVYTCSNRARLSSIAPGHLFSATFTKRIYLDDSKSSFYVTSYYSHCYSEPVPGSFDGIEDVLYLSGGFFVEPGQLSVESAFEGGMALPCYSLERLSQMQDLLDISETLTLSVRGRIFEIYFDSILAHPFWIAEGKRTDSVIAELSPRRQSECLRFATTAASMTEYLSCQEPLMLHAKMIGSNDWLKLEMPRLSLNIMSETGDESMCVSVSVLGKLSSLCISSHLYIKELFGFLLKDALGFEASLLACLEHGDVSTATLMAYRSALADLEGKVFDFSLVLWKESKANVFILLTGMKRIGE